jgi:signal transduction histidine kinase
MPTLNPGSHVRCGLLLMLAALHAVLLLNVGSLWLYAFLLIHLALFLYWQGQKSVWYSAAILLALTAAVFLFHWWAIAFWLTSLFGLIGAQAAVLHERWQRIKYIWAMAYLCAALLLWVAPNLFADQDGIKIGHLLLWNVLPVLLLFMPMLSLMMHISFPAGKAPDETALPEAISISLAAKPSGKLTNGCDEDVQAANPLHSLLLFMLLALLTFGSLAWMKLAQLDYHAALLRSMLLTGLVWLVLGGLWNRNDGLRGIPLIFSRYLQSTPFESWFTRLAQAAQREPDPASYLRSATRLLADLPWLSGLSWQSPDGSGQLGLFSKHEVQVQEHDLRLTIYARQSPSHAVVQHIQQIAQLVGYFYQAKQREQSLRNIARLQAVYETGSRLTHDLKNMLQSLLCITSLAQSREQRAQQLMQQQLPLLAQRIEAALGKLKQPHSEAETPQLLLSAWWDALKMRNRLHTIIWNAPELLPDKCIPVALFDCALDNLLDNALRKRQFQPGISISVVLAIEAVALSMAGITAGNPGVLRLTVSDNGEPIPESIAENLLRGVVVSENGLGIGVYQVARWAEQLGFRLTLASNRAGKVSFELRG